jgi:predicted glutamine amidotransferase
MCRLFGQLTTHAEPAAPWLVRTDRSLLAQSHASPETAQRDGWGVAWFTSEGRPHVVKGVRGAFEPGDREQFEAAANAAQPPLVIGHLRHASNPLGLTHAELLGPENSQPFDSHTAIFAHNGSIPLPRETKPFLGVHEHQVRGVNDSEVLFWLLVRNSEEVGDPLRGYLRTVEDLVRVRIATKIPTASAFSGLNVLYAPSPSELWAFCLWTGDHGCGLLDASRPYYQMTYRANAHTVVVGSEPFDHEHGQWTPLPSGQYLHARTDAGRLSVTTGKIPLPEALPLGPPPA